ncbi:MAG: phospholipase, partial [Proteobacteria bacterium]
ASLRARLQSDFNFKLPQIYWLGFSQGACLMLEFVARHAAEYGGIFGLSGGLIGPDDTPQTYEGSFDNTPIFLGCSDHDSHVPKKRVLESEAVFRQMGADVTTKLYPNFPHSINEDELNIVNLLLAENR